MRKGEVEGPIKSFIQNVHHFRDEGIIDPGPPDDHVVIFDEAQRAWNQKKAADFMLRRKKQPGFSMSFQAGWHGSWERGAVRSSAIRDGNS